MDCPLRTKKSFLKQHQKEHHTSKSPLTKLKQVDLINQVFLDSMHLFHLGGHKTIISKLIDSDKTNKFKLSRKQREEFGNDLKKIASGITIEF